MRLRRKKWAASTIARHPSTALSLEDLDRLPPFSRLEIGSGKGRFLLEMAKRNPSERFLGIEINYNAFSLAVKRSEEYADPPLTNFAFLNAPFQKVIPRIEKGSLQAIYLNFSDPWPRRREHKRRLTYPTLLLDYLSLLQKGGQVLFKTDDPSLFEDSLKYFASVPGFRIAFQGLYPSLDDGDVMTEFEEKFRSQGKSILRIAAVKA